MQIDFRIPREWTSANELVAAQMPAGSNAEPYVFQSIQVAIVEAVYGLSQQFSQRKKVFYIKNCDSNFDAATMVLSKMGYIVTGLDATVLDDPSGFASIIERDALLVLYAADDPILGRRYSVEKLEEALREKTLAQVRVSHNAHFFAQLKPETPRTGVHIYSVKPNAAIALCGERVRFGVLSANQTKPSTQLDLGWMKSPLAEAREKILKFETAHIADSKPVFASSTSRVYDRAVVSWPDVDGHAVIARLAQKLNIALSEPGVETRIETTSLSRWGGVRTFDFLKTQNLEASTLRGLVMISADLLDSSLEKALVETRKELLADQFAGAIWPTSTV